MKSYLLAAGYGTRLRPLTDTTPKCLIPIQDKSLLEWWCDLFLKHGVSQALINTHYLVQPVRDFITDYNNRNTGMVLHEYYESTLLGSGGTVRSNKDFVTNEENFFICYADNLTNMNLTEMLRFHNSHDGLLTMALFRANKPEQCGIAELDKYNKITGFVEKPQHPTSNLANAGVYIARQEIFSYFPDQVFIDFGNDVLPKLVGKMYGWETQDYLIDIGTPDNYMKAQREWANG